MLLLENKKNLIQEKKKQLLFYRTIQQKFVEKNRFFFLSNFTLLRNDKIRYKKSRVKANPLVIRQVKYKGPEINMRINCLINCLLKHGKKMKARLIVEQCICCLTEKRLGFSGSKLVNQAICRLEPPFLLKTIKKKTKWRPAMRIICPIWPERSMRLAAKMLVEGARARQRIMRSSFMKALFFEILDVLDNKQDIATYRIRKRYIKVGCKLIKYIKWKSSKK